jgi:hypothetical protein
MVGFDHVAELSGGGEEEADPDEAAVSDST